LLPFNPCSLFNSQTALQWKALLKYIVDLSDLSRSSLESTGLMFCMSPQRAPGIGARALTSSSHRQMAQKR
jgi:hypothetical protein